MPKFSKIVVIPPAVNLQEFQKISADYVNIFRKKFSIHPRNPVISFIGRINENKGVHYLIRCLPDVLKTYPTVKLIIVGPDFGGKEYINNLRKTAESLGIIDHVRFTGPLESDYLKSAYKASTIFVLPSKSEGFPISLLEAMASGVPTVTTDIPGTFFIRNGYNGIKIKEITKDALVEAILNLLNDKALREKIRRNAQKTAKEHSWKAVTDKLETTYLEIVNE